MFLKPSELRSFGSGGRAFSEDLLGTIPRYMCGPAMTETVFHNGCRVPKCSCRAERTSSVRPPCAEFPEMRYAIIGMVLFEMCETHSQAMSTLAWLNQMPAGKCSGLIGSESVRLPKPPIPQDTVKLQSKSYQPDIQKYSAWSWSDLRMKNKDQRALMTPRQLPNRKYISTSLARNHEDNGWCQ